MCLNYRQQHERAKETLQALEASGAHVFLHQADVSDRAQAAAMIRAVVERAGRLDILVNNAGISREGLFVEMSGRRLGVACSRPTWTACTARPGWAPRAR